jgi:uncharacterized protein
MKDVFSKEQILDRIKFENPWWQTSKIDPYYSQMKRREYFKIFCPLVNEKTIKRAVVLMGPRRVGKTVLLYHTIQNLMESGINPLNICYLSIETPIYTGIGLEQLFKLCREAVGIESHTNFYIFFDEIQYLKNWEIHLKSLVDSYHNVKFVVSGSAAAALKLKSIESGAGRFTDFLLPPLTFHEYIELKELTHLILPSKAKDTKKRFFETSDIDTLNKHFVDYINFGGYPEVIFSEQIQSEPGRYIRNDIIDKVLLRDLPILYGIQDIQELNSLFTSIAYNSGNEFSLDQLSQNSGVAKNTIKKYITYLEAAFLIKVIYRVDFSAKKFKRANFFKIYLTNPSLRSALFSPIAKNDSAFGNMVETAIFSQWQHVENFPLYYARWSNGEVDIVCLNTDQKPLWVVEIKWTNRFAENPKELISLRKFCHENQVKEASVTSIDIKKNIDCDNINLDFEPASIYCYTVGYNLVKTKLLHIPK